MRNKNVYVAGILFFAALAVSLFLAYGTAHVFGLLSTVSAAVAGFLCGIVFSLRLSPVRIPARQQTITVYPQRRLLCTVEGKQPDAPAEEAGTAEAGGDAQEPEWLLEVLRSQGWLKQPDEDEDTEAEPAPSESFKQQTPKRFDF